MTIAAPQHQLQPDVLANTFIDVWEKNGRYVKATLTELAPQGGLITARPEETAKRWGITDNEGAFTYWSRHVDFDESIRRFLEAAHTLIGPHLHDTLQLVTSDAWANCTCAAERRAMLLSAAEAGASARHAEPLFTPAATEGGIF